MDRNRYQPTLKNIFVIFTSINVCIFTNYRTYCGCIPNRFRSLSLSVFLCLIVSKWKTFELKRWVVKLIWNLNIQKTSSRPLETTARPENVISTQRDRSNEEGVVQKTLSKESLVNKSLLQKSRIISLGYVYFFTETKRCIHIIRRTILQQQDSLKRVF